MELRFRGIFRRFAPRRLVVYTEEPLVSVEVRTGSGRFLAAELRDTMGESARLRLSEVRTVFRLIGECRERGDDPLAWRRHYLIGLGKLCGAQVAVGGTWRIVSPSGPPALHHNLELGFESEQQLEVWRTFMSEGMVDADSFQEFARRPGTLITCARNEVASDRDWYGSREYLQYMRPAGVDASLASFYRPQPWNISSAVTLHRPIGERQFGERERRLLHIAQAEIGRLMGAALAGADDPSESQLPRRIRQTLQCLLEGNTDRQIALRLGVSQATVSEYATKVFRHFGVSSRPQLLAYFLKRHRPPRTPPEEAPS